MLTPWKQERVPVLSTTACSSISLILMVPWASIKFNVLLDKDQIIHRSNV